MSAGTIMYNDQPFGGGGIENASNVEFNNSGTGSPSTNVQDALVEALIAAFGNSEDIEDIKQLLGNTGLSEIGNTITSIIKSDHIRFYNATRRSRRDITGDLFNLSTAVSEQDLEKYGYTIGDYFIGPVSKYTYYVGDRNPYKSNQTNYAVVNRNHIGLVVDTHTNSTYETSGTITGYSTSTLHNFLKTTVLDNIKADMKALFGGSTGLEHLIPHDKLYNTVSSWGWSSSNQKTEYISALTEAQVYGSVIWSGNTYQQGEGYTQLELFRRFKYTDIFGYIWFWLRSIVSASYACGAFYTGNAVANAASDSGGAVALILFY